MLSVEKLAVSYGKMPAVHGIDFSVQPGEMVGILGANGAGKSTTLKAVMGILPLRSGSVRLGDADISALPTPARVRAGLGLVPEGRQIFPGMTVADNLQLAYAVAHGGRVDRPNYRAQLDRVYTLFPRVHERLTQRAGSLSGGEQQMVAVARGLLAQPQVLMLDEPSLGLAPVVTDLVLDVLQRLNQEGLTVIMVEQDAHRVLEVVQRAYVMESGRLVLSGSSAELRANSAVQAAFLGG